MRATFPSSMKSATLVHSRIMPLAVGLLDKSFGAGFPASSAFSTAPSAPDITQCAQGYSGCIGVLMKGDQPRSAEVLVLPAVCSLRIAVTGRQKLYVYFASKIAIIASSAAIVAAAV